MPRQATRALILLLALLPATAQEDTRRLTVEWIFGDEGKSVATMPEFAWTEGGDLLLYDRTRPEPERTLEWIRVESGAREPAVDAAAAFATLTEMLVGDHEDDGKPRGLEWPEDVAPDGTLAAYVYEDDLFLLDLAGSRFSRLAATPAEESLPCFSPDGRKLAFVRDRDLYVRELASGVETRLTGDGSETVLNGELSWVYWEEIFDREEQGFWWSPDSRSIAFLRADDAPVGEVVYPDIEPALPRVIRQRFPKAGSVNPDVRLGIVPAAGGKPVFLDRDAAPYEYLVGVTWLPDSARVAVQTMNRAQTRLDLVFVDRANGAATRVLTERDEGWSTLHELEFLDGGRRFVWSSERDGHTHLYLYEADGSLVRRLTEGAWSVRGPQAFYGSPLDSAFVDEERETVYFTALEKSPVERHLYRVGLDGSGLERISLDEGVHRVDFRADRGAWVDTHSGRCSAPTATLHVAGAERSIPLAVARADILDGFDWQCAELTTVSGDDGFPLPLRLLKPGDFDPGRKHPVILYVYGGPSAPVVTDAWAPDGKARAFFEQILLREGYVVASIDPRSATGVSKAIENTVAGKVWSDLELNDFLAGIRWLKAQPWCDAGRIGMWGWSGGGMSTLLTMTRSQELKAGIAVAPATDWSFYDTKFTEAFMRTPADNPQGYEHTSLVRRAGDLHGRLLLVYGTYDDNVHPQHALAFADGLIEAGKLFEMMVYPMRKHGIEDDPASIHLYKTMLDFWRRSL